MKSTSTQDGKVLSRSWAWSSAERQGGEPSLSFKDDRPEAQLQRKLQEGISSQQAPPVSLQRKANRTGMPDEVKTRMESTFNRDFSDVSIRANSPVAPQVGALAFTRGKEVHFAPGQFKPDTAGGKELLGHELTHVVQQQENKVRPTTQVSGLPVNDDPKLERQADQMGKKAAQG